MTLCHSLPADSDQGGFFDPLLPQPADALLALIGLYRRDERPTKIDVGVGVYRDDAGETPVLAAVKEAERRLWMAQNSKSYLGAEGDVRFTALLQEEVFGPDHPTIDRLTGVQTPGGSGALRLAAELIARAKPEATVWIGAPTWPNHAPIFREAGLRVANHVYFDDTTRSVDFAVMMQSLERATAGDVLLLHGCCHNPSGADLSAKEWALVAAWCAERAVMPLVDLAYHGLGDGLDPDAAATRMISAAVPEAMFAYSCDKNFGLYRDRVGALWVQTSCGDRVPVVRSNLLVLARSLWSMPPDHGAAVVRTVLDDPALRSMWLAELEAMRTRLDQIRADLASAHPALATLARQRGMFALLPLTAAAVATLRREHAIYMPESGRINLAGLRRDTIAHFAVTVGGYFCVLQGVIQ